MLTPFHNGSSIPFRNWRAAFPRKNQKFTSIVVYATSNQHKASGISNVQEDLNRRFLVVCASIINLPLFEVEFRFCLQLVGMTALIVKSITRLIDDNSVYFSNVSNCEDIVGHNDSPSLSCA